MLKQQLRRHYVYLLNKKQPRSDPIHVSHKLREIIPKTGLIMSFSPILSKYEVDVSAFNQGLLEKNRLVLPKVGPNYSMDGYHIKELTDLAESRFRIMEPRGGSSELVDPESICSIILPGLVFEDPQETSGPYNRIGRGKGYYDRYLARCNQLAYRIGVGYKLQAQMVLPRNKDEVQMLDEVILF